MTISQTLHPPRPQAPMPHTPYHRWGDDPIMPWALFYRQADDYLVRFPTLVDFVINRAGTRIEAWPTPGTDDNTIAHLFLNQCIPLARSLQGLLTLHGSAVALQGKVVAFLGHSGLGKSTLAASFSQHGHPFVSDDGLFISFDACGRCMVEPSHPSLRLWQDSEAALDLSDSIRAARLSYTDKSRILANERLQHADKSMPLAVLFALINDGASAPSVRALNPVQALDAISTQTFQMDTTGPERLAVHFDQICSLAHRIPVFTLDYPRRFDALPKVQDAVKAVIDSVPT